MNRGLHAGGTDHHDCGVPGRGEGNDGERGDELYVGEFYKKLVRYGGERRESKQRRGPEFAFFVFSRKISD